MIGTNYDFYNGGPQCCTSEAAFALTARTFGSFTPSFFTPDFKATKPNPVTAFNIKHNLSACG